jgi:hypothetical protein
VNLHDWIDELCDILDVDTEIDEALVLDVAREAAHSVRRQAAPITTYLLGYAAGLTEADPERVEGLAARVLVLAEGWDKPRDQRDPEDDDPAAAVIEAEIDEADTGPSPLIKAEIDEEIDDDIDEDVDDLADNGAAERV